MYFLEEVIGLPQLRSALAKEFRSVKTDDPKVHARMHSGFALKTCPYHVR